MLAIGLVYFFSFGHNECEKVYSIYCYVSHWCIASKKDRHQKSYNQSTALRLMQFRVWSFNFLHPKSDSPLGLYWRKLSNFSQFFNIEERQPVKIWHFLIFKVNFLCQKVDESLQKWLWCKNIWKVEELLIRTFFHYMIFWSNLLLKMCPIFDDSPPFCLSNYE